MKHVKAAQKKAAEAAKAAKEKANELANSEKTKDLLNKNKIEFIEVSLDYDQSARKLLKEMGCNTVPQIFNEEQHIGGYDDLKLKLTENI